MEILNINLLKTILILPIIDYIYISLIKSYFNQQIRDVQGKDSNFRIIPAVLCYIALIVVLYIFIINKWSISFNNKFNNTNNYLT